MKALIIGIDGLIGRALEVFLRVSGHEVVGTTKIAKKVSKQVVYLDLDNDASPAADLPKTDVAFFCAAMTKYDKCREDEQKARRVNAVSPSELATQLVKSHTRV